MAKKGFENLDPGYTPRDAKGRYSGAPERPPFTIEGVARDAIIKRHTMAEQRAVEGLIEAVKEKGLNVSSGEEAWGKVIKHRALQAMEQKGRSGVQDTLLVGRATGFLSDKKELSIESKAVNISADASDILMLQFLDLYPDKAEAVMQLAAFRINPAKWLSKAQAQELATKPITQEEV